MSQDTTVFTNMIASEYLAPMISKYQGLKCLDAIFMDGAVMNGDGRYLASDAENALKANTLLVNEFSGKAKVVRVPIAPKAAGSASELAEDNDAVEVTYTPTYVDVTIREYGKQKATVTGKAILSVFDGATAQMLSYMAACAADTKELLISALIFAGGTKAVSTDADTVKYFQVGAVSQGGNVFKPDGILTAEAIDEALVLLKDTAESFDNGLLMGVVHPEQELTLRALAGSQLENFQNYSAASPFPSNIAAGVIGAWKGVMWFSIKRAAMKIASGAHDGGYAYKTAIFGKNFLAKAFVDVSNLPVSNGSVQQMPFDDFVIRISPDGTDPHSRNSIVTYWFVGGYAIADRDAGLYIVAKSTFGGSPAATVA